MPEQLVSTLLASPIVPEIQLEIMGSVRPPENRAVLMAYYDPAVAVVPAVLQAEGRSKRKNKNRSEGQGRFLQIEGVGQ